MEGSIEDGGSADVSESLIDIGRAAGLTAVGIAPVEVFEETRTVLVDRKSRGLNADMQFTYRNPERSTDPGRILPGALSLVVGAWSYRSATVPADGAASSPSEPGVDPEPTENMAQDEADTPRPLGQVARYARKDHYASLVRALVLMAEHLRTLGWRATVVSDDNALVDRAAAHRAGLGWYGKNSLMLLPGQGSWFVLGTVVTDAPLTPSGPSTPTAHAVGCGSCSRCLTACPTGALIEPGVLDARRCLAWLVQAPGSFPERYRRALGNRIYGCDECQEVCPINRRNDRNDPPPPPADDERPWVDLLDLLASSDDDLMAAHGRWYIAGRDPRFLRRNALVALGNVGHGDDPATVHALRHWLGADDPMLVEHAQWAARELHRDDLVVQAT